MIFVSVLLLFFCYLSYLCWKIDPNSSVFIMWVEKRRSWMFGCTTACWFSFLAVSMLAQNKSRFGVAVRGKITWKVFVFGSFLGLA
jgi:hypothetical protein